MVDSINSTDEELAVVVFQDKDAEFVQSNASPMQPARLTTRFESVPSKGDRNIALYFNNT